MRGAPPRPPLAATSIGSSSRCTLVRLGGDDVEAAAVMGDDAVQFRERLDLVDDHFAHLRGALGGLLRHFQNAAAQFVAGGLQLVMHFGRHLLHARDHGRRTFPPTA